MFNLVGKGADITWGLAAGNAGQPEVVPDVASRVTSPCVIPGRRYRYLALHNVDFISKHTRLHCFLVQKRWI